MINFIGFVSRLSRRIPSITVLVLISLPWLNPFSPGPTAAVLPLLFSWVCAGLVVLISVMNRTHGDPKSLVRTLALAWLAAASVSALIGLLQYFGATAWVGSWLNHTNLGEAYGNLRQRNQFATLMNIGLAALLWWVANPAIPVTQTQRSQPFAGERLPLFGCMVLAVLLSAGNAASSSRTGLMQLALLAVLTWAWRCQTTVTERRTIPLRPVAQILLVTLLAYAAATVALPLLAGLDPATSGAWARLKSGDALCTSRLTLWGNVLHLIAQKPWMGWGWGELDYAHFVTLYPGPRFCDILDNAHNLPLHLAVELGLPVATLACGGVIWLLLRSRPWREQNATRQMAWSILAVIGLHSLLEYPLWYGPFQMAAVSAIWLLHLHKVKINQSFWPLARLLKASAAILTIASCLVFAWHYQIASQIYLAPENRMAAYREDTQKKIQNVLFFQDQVRFAELTTTDLTVENANATHTLALEMLHFSPEPRVIELVLNSAGLLGRTDETGFYALRYQAAFSDGYSRWMASKTANKTAHTERGVKPE